jgi:hypothetical protein
MGSVTELSAQDAAKFWPIYSEYDADLTKLRDISQLHYAGATEISRN